MALSDSLLVLGIKFRASARALRYWVISPASVCLKQTSMTTWSYQSRGLGMPPKLSEPWAVEWKGFNIVHGNWKLGFEYWVNCSVAFTSATGWLQQDLGFHMQNRLNNNNLISWHCGEYPMCRALSTSGRENCLILLALLTWLCMVGRICWSVFGVPQTTFCRHYLPPLSMRLSFPLLYTLLNSRGQPWWALQFY